MESNKVILLSGTIWIGTMVKPFLYGSHPLLWYKEVISQIGFTMFHSQDTKQIETVRLLEEYDLNPFKSVHYICLICLNVKCHNLTDRSFVHTISLPTLETYCSKRALKIPIFRLLLQWQADFFVNLLLFCNLANNKEMAEPKFRIE